MSKKTKSEKAVEEAPVESPAPEAALPTSPVLDVVEALAGAQPVAPIEEPKPIVGLDVFAASGGFKWDQMAGFVSYAQKKKLAPRTIPEWRQAHADFQNRPVR